LAKNTKGNKKKNSKKSKKPRTLWQKIKLGIKIILGIVLIAAIAVGIKYGSIILKYKSEAEKMVDEQGRSAFTESLTTIVYDADGNELTEFSSAKNSYYLTIDEIPYMARQIFIAIEDRKFYKHHGVDTSAVMRAVVELVRNDGEVTQGGSTITQQLARNIFLSHEVSVERKIKEAFIALKIEKEYSKDEILEFYINDIYFANGFYGLEAAAKGYFSKSATELSLSELAFICSIPNSPTLYDPLTNMDNTLKRRDRVLKQIYDLGYIDQQTYLEAVAETITLSPDVKTINSNYAETFVRYSATIELMKLQGFEFKNSFSSDEEESEYDTAYDEAYSECNQMLFTGGYRIYTSIDMGIQDLLQDSLDDNLRGDGELSDDGIYAFQGSATCIDNRTGYVVAIVGGRSQETTTYTLNRAYQSFRQPGSSIKPILIYAPLFERDYTPDSIVKDQAIEDGPVNSPNVYSGSITVRRAIKTSKNTIPWMLFEEMGYGTCINYLLNMNFSHIVEKDYTPAMSIGGMTYGVSTYEMASAYATLENDGIYRNPTCIKRIEDSFGNVVLDNGNNDTDTKQIYQTQAARMITDCMKDVLKSGTGADYQVDTAICAAKTGTTNDNKDTWLVGFSSYYTTAVWCGYDMPREIEGSLVKSAGNTWHDFMEKLHESLNIVDFPSYYDVDDDDDGDYDYSSEETEEDSTTSGAEGETETETTSYGGNEIYTDNSQTTEAQEVTTPQEEVTTVPEETSEPVTEPETAPPEEETEAPTEPPTEEVTVPPASDENG
jgi:membrane peptidoglycan carboxypeptidase